MSSLAAKFTAVSPFGPIVGKEMRVTARRKRNHWLRILYLGGLLLILLAVYSTTYRFYGYGGASQRAQQQARMGGVFFVTFAMFSVIAMGLIGPILTSTAIGSERLGKTLPVLLMTPITAWKIVSGKLFARLLIALMLIGLSLPVLALVRLLGGVELEQMFGVICLATVTALIGAAIGLFFSTLIDRAYAVILLAYGVMGFAYLFVPLVYLATMSGGSPSAVNTIVLINPFFAAGMLSEPFSSGAPGKTMWIWCVVVHLALTAILVACTGMLLRRLARVAGERPARVNPEEYIPVAAVAVATAVAVPPPLPKEVQRDAKVIAYSPAMRRGVSDNPILWRELRRPLLSKRWQKILATIVIVGMLLGTYAILLANREFHDHDMQIGYAFVFHSLMMLVVCVLSATAIAQEKEADTWTLLLATPVSARRIVLGKILGLLRRVTWPMVLIAAHFVLFTLAGVISLSSLFVFLWVIATFNVLWVATGVLLSLRVRSVTFAVILNLLLPVVVYGAVPLVLLILGELISNTDNWMEATGWYLPYYYLAIAGERLPRGGNYLISLPAGGSVSPAGFVSYTLAMGLLYLVVAAVEVQRTIAGFDRTVGRASQRKPSP